VGILSALGLATSPTPKEPETAQILSEYHAPVMNNTGNWYYGYQQVPIARDAAMAVPAVANCRNLVVNVLAPLELELYRESDDVELPTPTWLKQPDYRQPRAVTISWTLDSLFFYDVAYWRVTEVSKTDGRPSRFEFVNFNRVSPKLNRWGTEVEYYTVDQTKCPDWGVGSLITFQGMNGGGVLTRGGRTIQAALDLEKAVATLAQTPMPSGIILNKGADLPEDQITGLLSSWRNARSNRATAYLSANLEFQATQFSSEELGYDKARQYMALEIARLCNIPGDMIDAQIIRSNTYQNIQDRRRDFVDMCLMNFITAIEDRLSMEDLTPRGQYVKFEINEAFLRSDAITRLTVIEKMLQLGLISVQQAQVMEDLAPSEGTNVEEI